MGIKEKSRGMGSKTNALLQMLENKSEINICIYIENGEEVNNRPLSRVITGFAARISRFLWWHFGFHPIKDKI